MKRRNTLSALLLLLCAAIPITSFAAQQCALQDVVPLALHPVVDQKIFDSGVLGDTAKSQCSCESSVDKVMWGTNVVALIEGVSFDDSRNVGREGPVLALNSDGTQRCKADVENLRPPFALANGRYFYFVTADAVDFNIEAVDLNDCSISWKSPTHEWADVTKITYENGRYLVGKRKGKGITYSIQPNCQAAKESSH